MPVAPKFDKRYIAVIMLITAPLSGLGIDIYTPSLPSVTHYFSTTAALVKLTLSIYFLGYGIGQFFWGILSDSFGRRQLILLGLLIFVLATLGITFAPNIHMLLLLRLIQGLAAGAPGAIYRPILMDSFEGAELQRVVSHGITAWALGPIIAPVIGGYLQHYFNWQASFWFLSIYGAILLILIYFFIPETIKHLTPFRAKHHLHNFLKIAKHPIFFITAFALSLGYAMMLIFNLVAPYFIQTLLNKSAIFYGHIALLIGFGYFLGCVLNAQMIRRQKPENLSLYGLIVINMITLITLFIAFFVSVNVSLFAAPMILISLCLGFVQPNSFVKCLGLFPRIAGTTSSLLGSSTSVLTSIIASGAVLLKAHTQIPFSSALALLALLYLILYVTLIYPYFSK